MVEMVKGQKPETQDVDSITVKTPLGPFIFKCPEPAVYERLQAKLLGDSKGGPAAMREFCRGCLVSPGLEQFDELVQKRSGAPAEIANALHELSKSGIEITVKKA